MSMRIRYIGLDGRTRLAEINRIKFVSDGFKPTDKRDEYDDTFHGPAIIVHTIRAKGGKRLTFSVPDTFATEDAKNHMMEQGWLDLSPCTLKMENLY